MDRGRDGTASRAPLEPGRHADLLERPARRGDRPLRGLHGHGLGDPPEGARPGGGPPARLPARATPFDRAPRRGVDGALRAQQHLRPGPAAREGRGPGGDAHLGPGRSGRGAHHRLQHRVHEPRGRLGGAAGALSGARPRAALHGTRPRLRGPGIGRDRPDRRLLHGRQAPALRRARAGGRPRLLPSLQRGPARAPGRPAATPGAAWRALWVGWCRGSRSPSTTGARWS